MQNFQPTMMIWTAFLETVTLFLANMVRKLLLFSLVFSFCHFMGWIHRILWFCIEWYLSCVANGAHITVGSFEYDLLRGQILGYDVVVHTPKREDWKWESPLIARVGRVYVEFSILSLLTDFLQTLTPPVDIYTIEVVDVQVFIERQEHVFNFYLLDSFIILPDPKTIVPQDGNEDKQEPQPQLEKDSQEAHQLVENMLTSIQQLVSSEGSWKGALNQQRQALTSKLRQWQTSENKVGAVRTGVQVIRKVGQAVAQKTQDLPTAPERREDPIPPPNIRVGRILIKGLRIFTRDNFTQSNASAMNEWNKPIYIEELIVRGSELCPPMSCVDKDGLPAVYQPLDKVWEVVWKRLLAESAKSQGGRLLNTALGEMLDFMKVSKRDTSKIA
jgi:hypothetical protein